MTQKIIKLIISALTVQPLKTSFGKGRLTFNSCFQSLLLSGRSSAVVPTVCLLLQAARLLTSVTLPASFKKQTSQELWQDPHLHRNFPYSGKGLLIWGLGLGFVFVFCCFLVGRNGRESFFFSFFSPITLFLHSVKMHVIVIFRV